MSEKTLKFGDVEVNKKEFHASKQAIVLNLVDADKMVVSNKFKRSYNSSKYFIGLLDDDIIRPLCIILPQMSGYMKYSDDGGKNMYFKNEDDSVFLKYDKIWNKLRNQPIYDEKYIKTKVNNSMMSLTKFFQTTKFQRKKIITFVLQQ